MHKPFRLSTLVAVIEDVSNRRKQVLLFFLLLFFPVSLFLLLRCHTLIITTGHASEVHENCC